MRAVGEHHERWDGDGYPNGFSGSDIAFGARVVAVADAFDVLTSARSYKSPSSAAAARAEIQRCAGTQFDATVVRAFLNISVGRFRLVMGPLSWLAQTPFIGVPVAPVIGAFAGGFATAVGLLVGGLFQPPTVEKAPAAVIAAPAFEAPLDTTSVPTTRSTTSSTSTSSTTASTTSTSTTAPPAAAASPPTTIIEFSLDSFDEPVIPEPPVLTDDVVNGVEDEASIFNPLANDPSGLTLAGVSQPPAGTVTPRLDSTVRFDPPPNWSGTTSFTYTAVDTQGMASTSAVTVNYRPAADAPETAGDWLIRTEDSAPTTIDVTANDRDADLEPIAVTSISRVPSASPATGTVSITSSGRVRFAPNVNAFGNDYFIYFVTDPTGLTASGLLTVTLNPVNDPPIARNDTGSMNEDTTKTFAVRSNDFDVDGGPLTTTSVSSPNGTATTDGTTVTYRPAANSFGTHTVSYTISDGRGGTDNATLTVTVAAINDPPVARNDVASMTEDDPARTFFVLGNDSDIDGGPLSITSATSATGTATTNGSTLSYQPNPDGNGIHLVDYALSDGRGGTDSATLTVDVAAVNDPPLFTAGDDDTVAEDSGARTVAGWATAVGAGPIDEFGQTLTFNVTAADPTLFSVQPGIDGSTGDLTYTPAADANGSTTLTITLTDSAGATSAAQTADIVVTPVNDDPVAAPEAYVMVEGGTLMIPAPGLLGNDSDADDDPISVLPSPTAGPSNGAVTLAADGSFVYTPTPTFVGVDSFTYEITDGAGPTATADVEIFVDTGITAHGWYLGTSGTSDTTWDLVAAPLPVAEPEPDHDPTPDSEPGLTIKSSNQTLGENDPRRSQHWTLAPASPLVLEGPVVLDLWSSVKDFDDDKEVDYSTWLFDCATDGSDCQLVTSTVDVHIDDWNGNTPDWVFKSLDVGSVDHTVLPGRMLRLRLMFDHDDVWVAMSGNRPSKLVLPLANTAPVAGDDSYVMLEDAGPTVLTVLRNDNDLTLDPASVSVITPGPSLGDAAPQPDGTIIYTPTTDKNGPDSFDYEVCDSAGLCDTATVSITITPVNDDPSFTAGVNEVVAEDSGPQTVAGWATGIIAGPLNESSQTLTFNVSADDPSLFSVQPTIDELTGDLAYTPGPNENGTATLTITLTDSVGATSAAQTADITISSNNDAPVLDPIGRIGGAELTEITFTATATDDDIPADTLSFTLSGEPAGATIDPVSGVFSFTPTEAQGPGGFTFDVIVSDDGTPVGSNNETITVTVTEANVAPTIDVAAGATVAPGQAVDLTSTELSASDADLPAQTLTFTLSTAPVNGDVELTGAPLLQGETFTMADVTAGDLAYRHDGSATSTDTFDLTVGDGDGDGGSDGPTAFPISIATMSPSAITISEIRTDSQSGFDYVELYNGSGADIDLSAGWELDIEDRNGALVETLTLTGLLPANGYALITEATYVGLGTADVTSTLGAFDRGFGFSVRQGSTVIDAVGTSSGSVFAEGTPLPHMGGVLPQAYHRLNGIGRGACVDTDDNAADFEHRWGFGSFSPTGIADGGAAPCLPPEPPAPAPPPATHPVIREYRTDGPNGGSDEFVEIFNPGPDQDMTDWTVEVNTGGFPTVFAFPPGYVLEAGRHFLLAGPTYSGVGTPDGIHLTGVTNGNGVVIRDNNNSVVDAVAVEFASVHYEPSFGVGLPRIDGRTYHSHERRNNGCTDTDNNLADFEHHLGFETPTNNSAGVFGCV